MNISDALVVALVTIVTNFLVQLFFKYRDSSTHSKSIKKAIIAEIEAIINIVEQRNYKEDINKIIYQLEKNPNSRFSFSIDINKDIFPVYSHNLDKIGSLDGELAKQVVTFYSLLSSVIQDVKVGGILNNKEYGTLENFKNLRVLLTKALELGNNIKNSK